MPYHDREKKRQYDRARYRDERDRRAPRMANDEKKVLLQVRIPARLAARLDRLLSEAIANHTYPFRTRTQIVTYLLLGGFESMKSDPMVAEMLEYLRTIDVIENWRFQRVEAQAAFAKVLTEIGELQAIRATDAAVALYHHSREGFEAMTPSVWRDWLLTKLAQRYKVLHRQKPKHFTFGQKKARRST